MVYLCMPWLLLSFDWDPLSIPGFRGSDDKQQEKTHKQLQQINKQTKNKEHQRTKQQIHADVRSQHSYRTKFRDQQIRQAADVPSCISGSTGFNSSESQRSTECESNTSQLHNGLLFGFVWITIGWFYASLCPISEAGDFADVHAPNHHEPISGFKCLTLSVDAKTHLWYPVMAGHRHQVYQLNSCWFTARWFINHQPTNVNH